MNHLSLFSGIGGLDLAAEWAGFRTVGFVERDPYCQRVLAKHWPGVPIWDDVREFHPGPRFAGIISGGFPCQDISYAGDGAGLAGERSGLWYEFARIIGDVGPRFVVVENVAALLDRGLADVLGTLADLGFDAEWSTVSACSVGAPHMRQRVFIVAYSDREHGRSRIRHSLARAYRQVSQGDGFARARAGWRARLANPSALYGGADGIRDGSHRNRAIGNAVSPAQAYPIFRAIADVERERMNRERQHSSVSDESDVATTTERP